MTAVKPVRPPVLVFIVGCLVLAAALFFTVSLVENFDTAELRPRAFLFPLLLWAVGIASFALGIWQIGARRRYLGATTLQQRAGLEAPVTSAGSAEKSEPGELLGYESRVEE